MLPEKFIQKIYEITDELTGKVTRSLGEKVYEDSRVKKPREYRETNSDSVNPPGVITLPNGMTFDTNTFVGRGQLEQYKIDERINSLYRNSDLTIDQVNSEYDRLMRRRAKIDERMHNPTQEDLETDVKRQTEAQRFWQDLNLQGQRPGDLTRLSPNDDDYFARPDRPEDMGEYGEDWYPEYRDEEEPEPVPGNPPKRRKETEPIKIRNRKVNPTFSPDGPFKIK
jgi:hypothetical protein